MGSRVHRLLKRTVFTFAAVLGTSALSMLVLWSLANLALSESGNRGTGETVGGDLRGAQSEAILVTAGENGAARLYRGERLVGVIRGHKAPLIGAALLNGGDIVLTIDALGVSRATQRGSAERYHHVDMLDPLRIASARIWEPYGRKVADWALWFVGQVLPLEIPHDRRGGRGEVFKDCEDCPELVEIKSGSFMMGSPIFEAGRDLNEGARHLVVLSRSFALGRFEVTSKEWNACVTDGGCAGNRRDQAGGGDRRPVVNISWDDAKHYVAWISRKTGFAYRLPSEEEWEYAARAGTSTAYPWGNTTGEKRATCKGCGQLFPAGPTSVGTFEANPFGLYDMIGNVREWVDGCYHDYGSPEPSNCSDGVARGGSWRTPPIESRSSVRVRESQKECVSSTTQVQCGSPRRDDMGFRVARDIEAIPSRGANLEPVGSANDTIPPADSN
jgi:formylglycine-generating enzyme required for sulfatase activity